MRAPLFADRQDLLRQRRLERGLPAEPAPVPSARRLLLLGSTIGATVLVGVLASWVLISLRDRMVTEEIGRMNAVPGQLQSLEAALRAGKINLDKQTTSNEALANGLVAVASGSALLTQLAQLTPQGVQITEASVTGTSLSLKGRADEPGAFTRVNALSLLLADAPMFQPGDVRVIKLVREAAAGAPGAPAVPTVGWELGAGLATLKPAEQLPLLRKLGADGMLKRLQNLARTGVLP